MSVKRFCAACGAKLKPPRRNFLLPSLCADCAPQERGSRLMLVALFAFAIVGGYVAGSLRHTPAPAPFIGSQLDLSGMGSSFASPQSIREAAKGQATKTSTGTPDKEESWSLCGAPTKAGHPCRRKVKGWGYCYQHRDKYGQKPLPPEKKAEPPQNSAN